MGSIVGQLAAERRSDVGWKRAVILDRLQFDLFQSHYKRGRPEFSTLFLNSTAHYQHLYWRNMEPEHFKVKPDPGEQDVYQEAILFGYQQMDRLIARLLELAGSDTCWCWSPRQPAAEPQVRGHRRQEPLPPEQFQQLIDEAGITEPVDVTPVMAEEFNVDFESEDAAIAGKTKLESLRVGDQPAMAAKLERNGLRCQCIIGPAGARRPPQRGDNGRSVPFFDIFYRLDLLKSGQHHPDGLLWVHDPAGGSARHEGRVQLSSVVPTVLEMFDAPIPADLPSQPLGLV